MSASTLPLASTPPRHSQRARTAPDRLEQDAVLCAFERERIACDQEVDKPALMRQSLDEAHKTMLMQEGLSKTIAMMQGMMDRYENPEASLLQKLPSSSLPYKKRGRASTNADDDEDEMYEALQTAEKEIGRNQNELLSRAIDLQERMQKMTWRREPVAVVSTPKTRQCAVKRRRDRDRVGGPRLDLDELSRDLELEQASLEHVRQTHTSDDDTTAIDDASTSSDVGAAGPRDVD